MGGPDSDNGKMRRALRELPQAKNKDMRSAAPSPPSTLSFYSPPSPPPPPSKRRRLVQKNRLIEFGFVSSTGTEDDEADGQSTPADASTHPSQAADVADEVDEDDILAILDGDEVAFGDAIGDDRDEDFIPGPDDSEGSGEGYDEDADADAGADADLSSPDASSGGPEDTISSKPLADMTAASHMAPTQQMSDDRCKARFERRLRMIIEGLGRFADGIKYDPTKQASTYPISYSFWFLLRRVSADDLMESYMAAIPLKVKVLLGQSSLGPESILALDKDWKHYVKSKGIYIGLPFDKSTNDYECYIGSACRTLCRRISEHMRIAQLHTQGELPDAYARSLHYTFICKTNVVKNFRVLAAFPTRDVPDGYVHLLEAIMMIFFQSCFRSGRNSIFINAESHELMRTLRIDADVPQVQWTGLNVAWPAVQGFRMDRAPCKNKGCPGKTPHNAGFTLCYICTTFQEKQGRLPTGMEIDRLMSQVQKLEAARAKAGLDPECGDCGRTESFLAIKHLIHRLAPGVLLCGACVIHLRTYGVMHTAEEKAKLVGVSALISKRRTEVILCDNCAAPESAQLTRQHIYNTETSQVLCSACDSYRRMFSRDREPSLETGRQTYQDMKKQRGKGVSVNCEQCNAAETPDALHHYNHNTGKVLCKACDLYYRKHGKERDVSKETRRQIMLDVKKKREDGIPLYCDECRKTETAADIEKKHFSCVGSDNRFLCITCKNRLYRAASKAKKAAKDGVESGT